MSTAVVEVELAEDVRTIDVSPHREAYVVVRLHGHPAGALWIDAPSGVLGPEQLAAAVRADRDLVQRIAERLVLDRLASTEPTPTVSWSVAVCTRDRPEQLARGLASLVQLDPPPAEIIVVDNASEGDETRRLAGQFDVRYVSEPVPGLNRARRRAAATATTDVLVYTDDDVLVEPSWGGVLAREFTSPLVGAVTGLVLPHELDTPAQREFEKYGGHGRGFQRRTFDLDTYTPRGAGSLGAGASLAVRRELVARLGLFDANLDVGSPARTGGDTFALYLLLQSGHRVVYTPDALAWHLHRRSHAELLDVVASYSTGGFTWMLHALIGHRDLSVLRSAEAWFRTHHLRRLVASALGREDAPPRDIVRAELRGVAAVPRAYRRTREPAA